MKKQPDLTAAQAAEIAASIERRSAEYEAQLPPEFVAQCRASGKNPIEAWQVHCYHVQLSRAITTGDAP